MAGTEEPDVDEVRKSACDRLWRQLLDAPSPDRPARVEADLVQSILRLSLSRSEHCRLTLGDPRANAELRGWLGEIGRQRQGRACRKVRRDPITA